MALALGDQQHPAHFAFPVFAAFLLFGGKRDGGDVETVEEGEEAGGAVDEEHEAL